MKGIRERSSSLSDRQDTKGVWKEKLTLDQHEVCRMKGTETPFIVKHWDCKDDSLYCCICCGNELFDSQTKLVSVTGWPSLWTHDRIQNLRFVIQIGHRVRRMEVQRSNCGAFLSHVFNDSPHPTGKRYYCINSVSSGSEERKDIDQMHNDDNLLLL